MVPPAQGCSKIPSLAAQSQCCRRLCQSQLCALPPEALPYRNLPSLEGRNGTRRRSCKSGSRGTGGWSVVCVLGRHSRQGTRRSWGRHFHVLSTLEDLKSWIGASQIILLYYSHWSQSDYRLLAQECTYQLSHPSQFLCLNLNLLLMPPELLYICELNKYGNQ